jgi:hypothetical protein
MTVLVAALALQLKAILVRFWSKRYNRKTKKAGKPKKAG